MDEWHYQRGETIFGPITSATLRSLIQRGRLQGDTRVKRAGAADWSTVSLVLPDLPAIPEAPSSALEQPSNAMSFDSSLPGASVVYAPPQAALLALPQPGLPAFLWLGFMLCTAALLFEIACWISMFFIHLSQLTAVSAWPQWLQVSAQALTDFLPTNLAVTSSAVGMLTIIGWQGCAFASLKHLYGDMVHRSRASGLWWIVPIANFFLPLLCLRDLRYFSRKRRDFPSPDASFGTLLITMEVLLLIRFPINIFTALSSRSEKSPDAVWQVFTMHLVRDCAVIIFAATVLAIVIANFRQQRRLYAHWDDEGYWQKPQNR